MATRSPPAPKRKAELRTTPAPTTRSWPGSGWRSVSRTNISQQLRPVSRSSGSTWSALSRRRTVWRVLVLLLVTLLAAGEWAFVLETRLPAYTGPVAEGRPFPAFKTARADGSPFTQEDLADGQKTVMVFFRGRW